MAYRSTMCLSPIVKQRHVSVRVQELVRRLYFPVQRIDKEGRDAPDVRPGELRNTTRRLHLPSLSDNSEAAGDGGGAENTLAWKVVSERRALGDCVHCLNVSCRPVILSVNKKGGPRKTPQRKISKQTRCSTGQNDADR